MRLLCKILGSGEAQVPDDYYFSKPSLDVSKGAGGSGGLSKKVCVSRGYFFRVKFREGACFVQLVFLEKQALGKSWLRSGAGCGMGACGPGEEALGWLRTAVSLAPFLLTLGPQKPGSRPQRRLPEDETARVPVAPGLMGEESQPALPPSWLAL